VIEGGSICLKGKEDEFARRQEQLSLREVAIKRQEEELQAREATLKNKSDMKKDATEPFSGHEERGNNHATPSRKNVIDPASKIP